MKIAITDACIFIDLLDLQITALFFGLDLEVHTSFDVFNELYSTHQEILKAFQSVGKLTVHNLFEADRQHISKMDYPNGLSSNDKTVLYLADKLNAIVLSSDKAVRHQAKKMKIEYHGMLWIIDRLVEVKLVTHNEAAKKLRLLVTSNIIYQGNSDLLAEMNARLMKWEKQS